MAPSRPLRVLVTNDDGPPTPSTGNSPFVYPFARALVRELGWDVRVVVPSGQRSWVGKSYQIAEQITGQYFYPTGEEGVAGEKTDLPRPLKDGEDAEYILINGTPATCANLALHSLFPPGTFDLVISGPNFGRNTSTAFSLSSGTVGAAMAASLSAVPSIALSWGLVKGYKPPGDVIVNAAARLSTSVSKTLWDLGGWQGDVDVYTVNIPLVPAITVEGGPEVEWTTMAKTGYERLFKSVSKASTAGGVKDAGGPAAIPQPVDGSDEAAKVDDSLRLVDEHHSQPLRFVFAPDLSSLVEPVPSSLQEGTDLHAITADRISVTPIRSAFAAAAPPTQTFTPAGGLKWRL